MDDGTALHDLGLEDLAARYRGIDFEVGVEDGAIGAGDHGAGDHGAGGGRAGNAPVDGAPVRDGGARAEEADRIAAEVLRRLPAEPTMLFDRGLLAKWRGDWAAGQEFFGAALATVPEDQRSGESSAWNLGIAATARRDWAVAREAWRAFGIPVGGSGDAPVEEDFGPGPVRLNPAPRYIGQRAVRIDDREWDPAVVWGLRLDPARMRIVSVPLPASGHRCGDVVLHDGEPSGTRVLGEEELPVFDELELWERCSYPTLSTVVETAEEHAVDELLDALVRAGLAAEDWSTAVRVLCAACSAGSPGGQEHERPEHEGPAHGGARRTIGMAGEPERARAVVGAWAAAAPGRSASAVTVELE